MIIKIKSKELIISSLLVIILTAVAFILIFESAGEEPFLKFEARFAWTQLVAASVMVVLWLEFLGWVLYRLVRVGINVTFIIFLILAIFVLFWLVQIPFTYITDVSKFQHAF